MVVAIKNEMEQFFPLGLSKMQKNICTHSYRPILLIEKFCSLKISALQLMVCHRSAIWRKILTQMEDPRLDRGQMSQLALLFFRNIQREGPSWCRR